jgi:hypothetical protein
VKIKDTRDSQIFEGEFVTVIPANEAPSTKVVAKYYGVLPHHRNYAVIAAPCEYDRIVLDRGEDEDPHYYIVPKYPFYEVME